MEEFKMSKKLVAYFSASGVTKNYAERLANVIGVDLFEIKPKQPYTNADLNWQNSNSRSSVEMKNPDSRPEIAEKLSDMDEYDTVFVGFPIWWYVAPTIIDTFLESYDFSGKTIIPFATSGGSGMGKTADVLRKICPNADIRDGRLLNGMTDEKIAQWANEF
jgi:flavodoxin